MPYYAVAKGKQVGVYDNWNSCRENVNGYSGARFKKFDTQAECQSFIRQNSGSSGSSGSYGGGSYFRGYGGGGYSGGSGSSRSNDGYMDAYTDGSCPGNGMNASSAGRGVFFGPGHPWNVSERADGPPTNNRGEIQASRRAIEIAKANGVPKLRINTDSDFLVKSVNNYMPKWKENGWKTSDNRDVVNKDDFMRLDRELDGSIEVEFKHVPGHKGVYGNEQADKLAREGANK